MPTLIGVVERLTYVNDENGYRVFRLRVESSSRLITVSGEVPALAEGERVRLDGDWAVHPQYGRQFRIQTMERLAPESSEGVIRFLGSGLIKGVGESTARKLVGHFGEQTLEIIEREPERLTEVQGIGAATAQRIAEGYVEHRALRQVLVYFQGKGVSVGLASRIYRAYGSEAIRLVESNPYRLAGDVYGIGFRTADKIASSLGMPMDAPERIAAGIVYTLQQAAGDGHVYLPANELVEAAAALLGTEVNSVRTNLDAAVVRHELISEPPGGKSVQTSAIYMGPFWQAERGTAEHLWRLMEAGTGTGADSGRLEQLRARIEAHIGFDLAERQWEAVAVCLEHPVSILTGGPGTGKTTTVRAILAAAQVMGWRTAMAAPTGRAARRMAEATGGEAKTIHRLLEATPTSQGFGFHVSQSEPLQVDMLIVDETSMVDSVLAYHLVKAIPTGARVVFVGDADQLPSVGPGQVLADMMNSGVIPTTQLDVIFRQSRQSLIVENAHRIRRGQLPRMGAREDDFFFIEENEADRVADVVLDLCTRRLPSFFGQDEPASIQVLSPMRRGSVGIDQLNQRLQAALARPGRQIENGARIFREGDKVMQARNNYQRDVFNGDMGRILRIDENDASCVVSFGEREGESIHEVSYSFADLDELQLAYCVSVHKSQGSEFTAVVLPLVMGHRLMLKRNLLYTAMTRARRLVVIVGSRAALELAVTTHDRGDRKTRLCERLREGNKDSYQGGELRE